ncbi:unnamed protein product, partial [Rotaria sp. Silwood2]
EYETHRNRRIFLKDIEDEVNAKHSKDHLDSRREWVIITNPDGIIITLQNRAAMNTRLQVLYTYPDCEPFLMQSGTIMTHQTKSVTLPSYAQNIKVTVQKDMFANNWRDVDTVSMNGTTLCLRVVGVTVSSNIRPCE